MFIFFYRLFSLSLITICCYFFLIIGKIILFFWISQFLVWRNFMMRIWAKMLIKVLGIKIIVKGQAPKPPFYLISNHLSYIDVILFLSQVSCIFVARADLKDWPIWGLLAKSVNTLFINRNNKKDTLRINKLIERAMQESDGIVIFPEGTSSEGSKVLPFKSPLFEYAAQKKFPVSYATINYRTGSADPPAHLSVCWWGGMKFVGHFLDLLKLSKIDAIITFGATTVQGDDRKSLARELWERINQQFVPTVK